MGEGTKFSYFCAINLKQMTVVFNQPMKKTVAETLASYTVTSTDKNTSTAVQNATLQSDNKTVILTLTGSYNNQFTGKSLTIKNMEAVSGEKLTSFIQSGLAHTDTTAPSVLSVETTGPRTIDVTFSEPVTRATDGTQVDLQTADFKVDSGSTTISSLATSTNRQVITLTTGADLVTGSHTLEYSSQTPTTSIRDHATLPLLKGTATFTHALPSEALAATVTTAAPDKIRVTYNRAVKNVNTATIYANYTSVVGTAVAVTPDANNFATAWDITFTTPLNGTVALNIKNDNASTPIQDRYAVKPADQVLSATVAADTTKPEVTTVVASTNKIIKVDFSKDVNTSDAQNRYNYTILSEAGVPLTTVTSNAATDGQGKPASTSTLVYTAANKQAVITLPQSLTAGNYQLKIENIKDTVGYSPNTMLSTTKAFTISDSSDFVLQSATLTDVNKVSVTFNKNVATSGDGSALLAANFKLNLNADSATFTSLPDNSTVAIGDQPSTVVITLGSVPAGFTANTSKIYSTAKSATGLSLGLGASQNNKVISAASNTAVTAGDIQNVKLLAHNQVSFEVTKPLSGVSSSAILVATDVQATGATYTNKTLTNGTYGAEVVVTTADNALSTWVSSEAVGAAPSTQVQTGRIAKTGANNATDQLVINAGGLTNAYSVANTSTVNVANLATVKDLAAPRIVSYTTGDSATANGQIDKITAVYSEKIKTGVISNASYEVKDGAFTYAIANVAPTTGGGLSDTIVINLTERGVGDTAVKPAVRQLVAVNDTFDNQMAAQATANVAATIGANAVITSMNIASNNATSTLAKTGDKITVNFTTSEPVTVNGTAKSVIKPGNAASANNEVISGSGTSWAIELTTAGADTDGLTTLAFNIVSIATSSSVAITEANITDASSVTFDKLAPTVTTKLSALGSGVASSTVVFSEAIDSASRDAVKTIVDAAYTVNGDATVSSAWAVDNKTLTVTVTDNTGSVDLAALTVPAGFTVKDLAGNISAALNTAALQN